MTSVPWLKDLKISVADPIDPVCLDDKRPAVKDFIAEHRESIEKIRAAVETHELFDPSKHDDFWILRFALSHKGKVKAAKAAIETTLQFRKEQKLDEKDIRANPPQNVKEGPMKEFCDLRCPNHSMVLSLPDERRGVVCFLNITSFPPGASKLAKEEVWRAGFIYPGEWTYQWLDYISRKTGRLTRQVRILDAAGFGFKNLNREDLNADGAVMNEMEDCYPQLLETIKVCNAPFAIHALSQICRPLLPKRVREKFDIINPKDNERERRRLYKWISEENLPVHYGGKNATPTHEWQVPTP